MYADWLSHSSPLSVQAASVGSAQSASTLNAASMTMQQRDEKEE
jgi:hypothetical protein